METNRSVPTDNLYETEVFPRYLWGCILFVDIVSQQNLLKPADQSDHGSIVGSGTWGWSH